MDNNVGQTEEKSKIAPTTANTSELIAATHSVAIGAKSPTSILKNSTSFWKNSGRAVPGRPSPKRDFLDNTNSKSGAGTVVQRDRGNGGGMVSTFRDYQQSVSDAWDTGDDEFCIISSTEAAAAAAVGGKPQTKLKLVDCLHRIWRYFFRCHTHIEAGVTNGGA